MWLGSLSGLSLLQVPWLRGPGAPLSANRARCFSSGDRLAWGHLPVWGAPCPPSARWLLRHRCTLDLLWASSSARTIPSPTLLPPGPSRQRLNSSCGLWVGDGLSQLCPLWCVASVSPPGLPVSREAGRGQGSELLSLLGAAWWVSAGVCLSCHDPDSQDCEPEPMTPAWIPRAPLAGPRREAPAHRGGSQ